MYDVPPAGTTRFRVQALYTFGSPPVAKKAIVNPLHPSGCFRGKRIFNSNDQIAAFMGVPGLVHPRYDSIEVWELERGATFKVHPCLGGQKRGPAAAGHDEPGP